MDIELSVQNYPLTRLKLAYRSNRDQKLAAANLVATLSTIWPSIIDDNLHMPSTPLIKQAPFHRKTGKDVVVLVEPLGGKVFHITASNCEPSRVTLFSRRDVTFLELLPSYSAAYKHGWFFVTNHHLNPHSWFTEVLFLDVGVVLSSRHRDIGRYERLKELALANGDRVKITD